jgi:hypothetical protein
VGELKGVVQGVLGLLMVGTIAMRITAVVVPTTVVHAFGTIDVMETEVRNDSTGRNRWPKGVTPHLVVEYGMTDVIQSLMKIDVILVIPHLEVKYEMTDVRRGLTRINVMS